MAWIKYIVVLSLLALFVKTTTSKSAVIKKIHHGGIQSESPLWVNEEGALYWVDTVLQKIYRLEIDTGDVTSIYIEYGPVSLIVSVKNYPKLLVISVRAELYFLNWNTFKNETSLRLITAVDLGLPDNRCKDGRVDARGRFWFGTMGREKNVIYDNDLGSVYMMTDNNYKSPEIKIRPVSISNGIAWSSDNNYMFYIDSVASEIAVYDFDLDTGSIENRRKLFSFTENNFVGYPDGMTIDRDDNLWVACYLDGKVIKINSRSGKLLEQYKLPATKVTSVMWGGYDYSTLYVTTASKDLSESDLAEQPEAGSVFAIIYIGTSGFSMNKFIFKNADIY